MARANSAKAQMARKRLERNLKRAKLEELGTNSRQAQIKRLLSGGTHGRISTAAR